MHHGILGTECDEISEDVTESKTVGCSRLLHLLCNFIKVDFGFAIFDPQVYTVVEL